MNPRDRASTFLAMSYGRLLRRLLVAVPAVLGMAGGASPVAAGPVAGGPLGASQVAVWPTGAREADDSRLVVSLPHPGSLATIVELAAVQSAEANAAPPDDATQPTIRTPGQSLPTPVHDEATCAFCQGAIFPPCAPQPTRFSIESLGLVREECATADAVAPQFTTHRLPTTRAPPSLRSA